MDYYELLGLGHVAMRADQDLIKRACTYTCVRARVRVRVYMRADARVCV
jgi:hypothetical protein